MLHPISRRDLALLKIYNLGEAMLMRPSFGLVVECFGTREMVLFVMQQGSRSQRSDVHCEIGG